MNVVTPKVKLRIYKGSYMNKVLAGVWLHARTPHRGWVFPGDKHVSATTTHISPVNRTGKVPLRVTFFTNTDKTVLRAPQGYQGVSTLNYSAENINTHCDCRVLNFCQTAAFVVHQMRI